MNQYNRLSLLVLIMAGAAIIVGTTSIGILYQTSVDQQRLRLIDTAQSQARLLEAIARFAQKYSAYPEGAQAATLAQMKDAHAHFQRRGLGRTGELMLARREGDNIAFVLRHRHLGVDQPEPLALNSGLAEPMRRALSGLQGTVIGADYRGERVLAAYEPVDILDLGIVAKIDLSEIRAPFVTAGAIVIGIAFIVIAGGTALFFRVSEPIIRQMEVSETRFRELFNNLSSGAAVYQAAGDGPDFTYKDLNRAGEGILDVRRHDILGRSLADVLPKAREFGLLDVMRRVWRTGQPEHFPTAFYDDGRISGWRKSFVYKLPSGDVVSLFEDVTNQQRAEQTLRESEERFRSITQTAGDAIISVDTRGSIVLWNRAAERIFGYPETEMFGEPLAKLLPERHRGPHEAGMERVAGGGPSRVIGRTMEVEGLRKDGTEVPLSLSISTWTSGGDKYFTGILRDISERRRSEQRLRESDARWRSLIEMRSFPVLIVGADRKIRFANQAAEHLFRQRAEILMGMPFGHPMIEGDLAEIEIPRGDGTIAYGEMQAFPSEWRGEEQHLVTIKDVTGRKRAERDINKLFQAIQQSPASVVITDVEGNIEYVNPKFCEVTGYALGEVIGKTPRVLKSGHTPQEDYAQLWTTIKSGRVWRGEFRNRTKAGDLFWELASIAPVKDTDGNIINFVCVKEDVTQRKITEEQLRRVERIEAVGQLTGGIAHDFNNLLAIILGNLQLIEERVSVDPKTGELIRDALWSARRGAELTHRLLAFGRRQPLKPQVISVNQVVSGMAELLRRTLGPNVEIHEDLSTGLWSALADRGELERAVVNLAVNARDAMRERGTLTIETRNVALNLENSDGYEEVKPGNYVMLAITDTGMGMSQQTMARIFEPFFTTKGVGKGSGLGLSMVYGFVKQSGGHVTVSSEVGRGTTVRIYLPRVIASTRAKATPSAEVAADALAGKVVLLVEDEAKLRDVAVKMLENVGLRVTPAESGPDALERLQALPHVDLLFTDLALPGDMGGAELAAEVRKLRPDIKVLCTTGYAPDSMARRRLLPADLPLITKPYSQGDLATKIGEVLSTADEAQDQGDGDSRES